MEEIMEKEQKNKKEPKKMKSFEERILIKKQELEALLKAQSAKEEKDRKQWIRTIIKPLEKELLKIYEENKENSLNICTALLYSLENFKELSELAGVENYVVWNKSKSQIVKTKHEDELKDNKNPNEKIIEKEVLE